MDTTTPRPILTLYGHDTMAGHYMRQIFSDEFDIRKAAHSDSPVGYGAKDSDECEILAFSHGVLPTDAKGREAAAVEAMLKRWEAKPPKHLIYISSYEVYGKETGENVDETDNLWAKTAVGINCQQTEGLLEPWSRAHGVTLTILRPAMMFGSGVEGEAAEMFDAVVRGTYINIREHAPLRSLVLAYDVARVAKAIYRKGGVYNVTDGLSHTLPQLARAMGQNAGRNKSCYALTYKWAKILGEIGDKLPFIGTLLTGEKLLRRTQSLTFSNAKLAAELPADFHFFNTLEVIARTNTQYPYEDR